MKIASKSLIGEHDFRNFCKMDVGNGVVEFKRRIMDVQIEIIGGGEADGYSMCRLKLIGQAFLWVLRHKTINHETRRKLNIPLFLYFVSTIAPSSMYCCHPFFHWTRKRRSYDYSRNAGCREKS